MSNDFIFDFILLSASLNAVMMILKRIKKIKEHSLFLNTKAIIPPVLGTALGFFVFREMALTSTLLSGFLAGTLCTTSYEIFKMGLKRKDD
jgi:hypothetical protein